MANIAELSVLQSVLGLSPATKTPELLQDAVFLCIDCEAFEFAQEKITEIGVAVLDTRNIRGVAAGENGVNWLARIACAHYRIEEYKHLINKRWVKGDPEGFAFGQSTFISRKIAGALLAQIFHDPSELSGTLRPTREGTPRNVILVGHGLRNDSLYLKKIGFSFESNENVVRRMDTQVLSGGKKRQVALGKLLQALEITPVCSLHNAGNDAVYTLRALITMGIREHAMPGQLLATLTQQRAEREAELAAQRAEMKAKAEAKENITKTKDSVTSGATVGEGTIVGAANVARYIPTESSATASSSSVINARGLNEG